MGIAGDGRFSECAADDDVGGFSADAGQGYKLFYCIGDFSGEPLQNCLACIFDIGGLVVIEAGAFYILLNLFYIRICPVRQAIYIF